MKQKTLVLFPVVRRVVAPVAVLAALGAVAAVKAQSIANAGFETDTYTVWPGYAAGNGGVITGWTLGNPGNTGLNPAGGSPFADNGAVPEGVNVALMQTNAFTNTFSSTAGVTGLTPGQSYQLQFRTNARLGSLNLQATVNVGASTLNFEAVPVGGANPYALVAVNFTATGTSAPLGFSSTSPGDSTILLDDLKVVALPSQPWKVAPWTGDASSGIVTGSTVRAVHFASGNSTVINGVNVLGVAGGSPAVAGNFSTFGYPNVLGSDTNDLTAGGGGSGVMADSFLYGANADAQGITLESLTPGQAYQLSLFGVGWGDAGEPSRTATFGAGGNFLSVNEEMFGGDRGLRVSYDFTASGTTETVSWDPVGDGSFHLYGFALNVVPEPGSALLAALGLAGFVRRRRA